MSTFHSLPVWLGLSVAVVQAAAPPQGDLVLPTQATVFGPFAKDDGVPAAELLRRVPDKLAIGDKQVAGRPATFDAKRRIDCAAFCGQETGSTTWVYLPFTAAKAGPATFGFGADWWYEAYLDGQRISETLSRTSGNELWPPSIHDFTTTVELKRGAHVLAVRLLRGTGSAALTVGGPFDLRNPATRLARKPTATAATVTAAGDREGPPADQYWKLVWQDEFDGTKVDDTKWEPHPLSKWDWPGLKTQADANNLFLDGNGSLVVQLTQDADGTIRHPSSLSSLYEQAYGYFETRVKFSTQPGWWTAVWMAGYPYDCGVDTFVHPQEFDIFEDFYKPKQSADISHCYHCSVKLERLQDDQGNAKGVGEGFILNSERLGRTSSGRKVVMENYDGWHTVGFQWTPLEHIFYVDGQETLRQGYQDVPMTNVPQKIWISACLRAPKNETDKPFYGRLEEATFPDQLVVDYVRIYQQDPTPRALPRVTLKLHEDGPFKEGQPVSFDVSAESDGKLSKLLLFSMGRLRAEVPADEATATTTFTVDNLFRGPVNTVIAMAEDDAGLVGQSTPLRVQLYTGREFTGTPFEGQPQAIPGTIKGGHYDTGGQGVAFRSDAIGPSDARLEWRRTELGSLPEAVEVGGDYAKWITYEVEVAKSGEYDVELFMNRPDYSVNRATPDPKRSEQLKLNLGEPGSPGTTLLTWELPVSWQSGVGWRVPQKSLGIQRVKLPAGRHKLILFADEISIKFTFFCRLVFTPVE